MKSVMPWPLQEGVGVCGPLLAQASRFSSSYRYWLWVLLPVVRVVMWLPLASWVMVKGPIAVGPWGLRASVSVGVVVAGLRLHRAGGEGSLGLLGDVVDRVVALAESVALGGAEAPVRGDQPVEVVILVLLVPRPADGVAEVGEAVGVGHLVVDLGDVADRIIAEEHVCGRCSRSRGAAWPARW